MTPAEFISSLSHAKAQQLRAATGLWTWAELFTRMGPDTAPFGMTRFHVEKLDSFSASWRFLNVDGAHVVSLKWVYAFNWVDVLVRQESSAYFALLAAAVAVHPLSPDDVEGLQRFHGGGSGNAVWFLDGQEPVDRRDLPFTERAVCPFLRLDIGAELVVGGREAVEARQRQARWPPRRSDTAALLRERQAALVASMNIREITPTYRPPMLLRAPPPERVPEPTPEPEIHDASPRRKLRLT